ncbi:hypothetical protein BBP40_003302 [Aspergillus hancockii]|nr:hypothetical protein BBP40_003302 [Aspergillus hancockii]
MAHAAIHNKHLYILSTKTKGEVHRHKILTNLPSIHRALISTPVDASLPNTEFIFSIEDKLEDLAGPVHLLWVLARKATEKSVWLMPDFGFWTWGNGDNGIGPYDHVVEAIRGSEKDWEDVREVEWKSRSHSASLKYRQACRSVIIIHTLQYIQHHHYLLISSRSYQRYVQVEHDISDLPRKMQELLDDLIKAQQIADNSLRVFRDRYLTPAAEACYWRALL